MINIGISIIVALAVGFGLYLLGGSASLVAPIIVAVVILLATFFILSRRMGKVLEGIIKAAQDELMKNKIEPAIKILTSGFRYQRRHILIASQIHAQLGMIYYIKKEFKEAEEHLRKSYIKPWSALAMLAVMEMRKKNYPAMKKLLEKCVTSGKKVALAWAVYAFCLCKIDKRKEAMEVLSRGTAAMPSDLNLKSNLIALQNNKRMKMKGFGQEWFQFHLEKPPVIKQQVKYYRR